MAFNAPLSTTNLFRSVKPNKIIEGSDIKSFKGHLIAGGSNILNYNLGELIYNKNMEWLYSGSSMFLRTKRGSSLYLDITFSSLGAGVFYKSDTNYIVWVDIEGNLKYRNSDGSIVVLHSGLDTSYRHEFWFYGLGDNETLYGCNRNDGIYKITMPESTITYTSVLSTTGAWSMSYSNISGRLFFTNGHKALFGLTQNQTATDTTNLEDFDTTNQTIWVSPDQGDGIQKIIENGEITFYFKDTGIWALINAEQDAENWLQPQCDADVGTKSPDTVRHIKYGASEVFIYLGTDKTLRTFNAQVVRNSGTSPTLTGGNSLIISNPFQKILSDIPDGQLSKCKGFSFQNYYILSIVSSSATEIDSTIIIDTDKLMNASEADDIAQPFWFYTDNMEFENYVILDNQKLYGFHKSGYIAQLFVDNKYYEEMPDRVTPLQDYSDYIVISGTSGTFVKNETVTGSVSGNTATTTIDVSDSDLVVTDVSGSVWSVGETITGSVSGATATIASIVRRAAIEWEVYTGWHKFGSQELRFYDSYINWGVDGNWNINFTINSFILGDSIPDYDDGITFTLEPQNLGGAYFDYDYFNQAYFSSGQGQLSQNTGGEGRGHYFSFGFYNKNYNEWATVYSMEPRFEVIKNDVMGRNF